ncbi:molecular chaperone [Stutzerimonas urumqiensis]|uniref:molecular chaperone n=1 Tax=Stutzerimonas urumqiensis TaxID=638269 RepID=UPI003DA2C042
MPESQTPHLLLRIPTPTGQTLSFCEPSPRGMKRWLEALPRANLGESSRQLYQALIELNQLRTPSENRLQMLELLRPEVHLACQLLERHLLNQPVVLDERARKIASLCQALQSHLATGYKLIVARLASTPDKPRPQLMAVALQRALHSLRGPLVRACQLYCPVPEGLWLELHQLHRIAVERELSRLVVKDDLVRHAPGLSVEHTYLASLLLGCARLNQIRQGHIACIAEALEAWAPLARLRPAVERTSTFVVPVRIDAPPRYRAQLSESEAIRGLGLDTSTLIEALDRHLAMPDAEPAALAVPRTLSEDVLCHLRAAWGNASERSFQRTRGDGALEVCVGISAIHFYLAGKRPFDAVIAHPKAAGSATFTLQGGEPDVWASAFDARRPGLIGGLGQEQIEFTARNAPAPSAEESYPTQTAQVVNQSPGGYCLRWSEVPPLLQAGELLAFKLDDATPWNLAVVRWIRQVRDGTDTGIELIGPGARSVGLRLVRKQDQGSQYLRALILPAIAAISRPATLIAPRVPFQEGHKVELAIDGGERRAILSQRIAGTSSFSQFEFRALDTATVTAEMPVTARGTKPDGGPEDFDSLWKSL